MNDASDVDLVVDGRKRHAVKRAIDAEERDGADAHARQQNQIHMSRTDQVGESDAEKCPEYGDCHRLRSLLRREISHVVCIHKTVANTCARCAPRQPTDVLPHIRRRGEEEEIVGEERREDFQPGGNFEKPCSKDPPSSRVGVQTTVHETL